MNSEWRLRWGFPAIAQLPGLWPWRIAPLIKRDSWHQTVCTEAYLCQIWSRLFPGTSPDQRQQWARQHTLMLAWEMCDAWALNRVGQKNGPGLELEGLAAFEAAEAEGRGVVLVLNHVDRLLATLLALAAKGFKLNMLTMPVVGNAELSELQQQFLLRKITSLTKIIQGEWRTSDQPLRVVLDSLRRGGVWVILADVWRPEFSRLRDHPFLGGHLQIPTGIERLAQSAGARLVHGVTRTQEDGSLLVHLDDLPEQPVLALNQVIRHLESDVMQRPWAWWQWGLFDSIWKKCSQEHK